MDSSKLAPEAVAQYIYDGRCPFCGSGKRIGKDSLTEECDAVYRSCFCGDCRKSWTEGFTLDRLYADGNEVLTHYRRER